MSSDDINTDGSEKLAWSFSIAGTEEVELQDGTSEVQPLAELRSTLWSWAKNHTQLSFKDTDGQTYTVKVDSLNEQQPVVMPPAVFDDPSSPISPEGREAFYSLVLVQV